MHHKIADQSIGHSLCQIEILMVSFILFAGSISSISGGQYDCKDGTKPEMIAGVVGAPSSVTSIQVANLLKLFKMPQVSGMFLKLYCTFCIFYSNGRC